MTAPQHLACADHPAKDRVKIYDQDGVIVEGCRACGYSIEGGKTSAFRTCPFCGDWFIDELDEGGTEVVCQGCGATAPSKIWNTRDAIDARSAES